MQRCRQSNPNISDWMEEMGFEEYNEIEEYYSLRIIDIVLSLNASVIAWQDPIDNNVTVQHRVVTNDVSGCTLYLKCVHAIILQLNVTHTRIGVWKDDSLGQPGQFENWRLYMQRVTQAGYDAYLLAPWYLNYISYGEDWRDYYAVEPFNFTGQLQFDTSYRMRLYVLLVKIKFFLFLRRCISARKSFGRVCSCVGRIY